MSKSKSDLNSLLGELKEEDRKGAVLHALQIRSALSLRNYHRFFQLYLTTPNMGAYLIDHFILRERLAALKSMCRA